MRSCCGNITTFLLLLVVSTQARTWRTAPSIIRPSTTLPLSFMRGGSDAHDDTRSGIPIVPESTSSVSRGGSTTTKSLPSSTAATTTTPSYSTRITGGIHAAGAIATTTTTPSVEAVPVNISSSELTNRTTAHVHHPPVSAREMRKAEKQAAKELKRHKKIAKKLKVSCRGLKMATKYSIIHSLVFFERIAMPPIFVAKSCTLPLDFSLPP